VFRIKTPIAQPTARRWFLPAFRAQCDLSFLIYRGVLSESATIQTELPRRALR
jgi:hypothetical protein